jgi:hypothetical protein
MMAIALLLMAAPPNVTIEQIPDGRFRVVTVSASDSPEELARAMLRLRAAAQEQCRGRGIPVAEGALVVDDVARRPGRLSLAETYGCARPPG